MTLCEPSTLLDALVRALQRAGSYNPSDQAPPAAILWPDKEGQWEVLLPELRNRLPLLTLGEYRPEELTGPAYYLRCMIAGALADDRLADCAVPIAYLPGVSRQDLRAIDECPRPLQPLAELQYRGVLWTHRNGRDWTVAGYLQNADDGLGIAVGADVGTREALLRALPVLARQPLDYVRSEAPLRAPFLNALMNPDDERRLLLWMSDPNGYRAEASLAEWGAFCALCAHKYSIRPQEDGEFAAAQRLGQPAGPWETVWKRFLDAPQAYPNLPDLLHRAVPEQRSLFEQPSPYWPQDTGSAESALREGLLSLRSKPPSEARAALAELEEKHGERRTWVWAKLGRAPMAHALRHLVSLSELTASALGGADVTAIAEAYAAGGWQADAAALEALAAVETSEDIAAVGAALAALYHPWLEASATAFQGAILGNPAQNYVAGALEMPPASTCVLFSDALRFDLGQRLAGALEARGFACPVRWSLAALPTVTATAKPAVVPVADKVCGGAPGLTPVIRETGAEVSAQALRKLLQQEGYQVLEGNDTGDPTGVAWTEIGAIDQYGHGYGWRVAVHGHAELRAVERRIADLLDAGWERVVVITDHGWLLMPGGLPKVELPEHLTLERKGRCAVLKEGAQTDQGVVPWHWDQGVRIAVAPGIGCYEAGREYEHGGLSPQECVVPVITVSRPSSQRPLTVTVEAHQWRGLRCRIVLAGATPEMVVDLRTKAANATTSLLSSPASPGEDGTVSLLVEDADRLGEAAFIVVFGPDGTTLHQTHTTVGG